MADALVEILTDGSHELGTGHVRRSRTLAAAMGRRGIAVSHRALSAPGQQLLGEAASSPAQRLVSLRVLDLPYEAPDAVRLSHESGTPCVALDSFEDVGADLTISVLERSERPPPGRRLAGLRYAIIREDVRHIQDPLAGSEVLVCVGGGDVRREGPVAAQSLSRRGAAVRLVEGPAVDPSYAPMPGVEIARTPPDLAGLMANCAWAVANGGITMTELMCLGKATHVLPQTSHEERLARHVLDLGGILGIGLGSLDVSDVRRCARVGGEARKLVDGNGVERIVDELERFL